MAFVIQYFSRESMVWETIWGLDVPPSCRQVRANLAVHCADRAIILDDNGFELVIEERQKFDA
jgi:hypothetical protein